MPEYQSCKRCGVQRLRSYQHRYKGEDIYCAPCRRVMRGERNTVWMEQARCAGVTSVDFFAEEDDDLGNRLAIAICNDCPVRAECLAMSIEEQIWFGVWGGLTAAQRARVKMAKPSRSLVVSKPGRMFVREGQDTRIYADQDLARCRHCGKWSVRPRLSDGICSVCQGRTSN